ncbi:MAG: transglycosylase SLT domain-containing protein [Pseudomonadota bacterium]
MLAAIIAAAPMMAAPAAAYVEPRLKPPAPGPKYVNVADHARLDVIVSALKRRDFSIAKATAGRINDPIAKSLGQWLYYYADDPSVDLAEADRFLDLHQDWPATSRIQTLLEKKLKNTTPTKLILDFYDTRDPVGGHGKLQLARALFSKGEQQAGEIHLRDAWVNHTFPLRDERRILSAYASRLKPEDHAARVDHLLWKRQVTNARRIIPRLTSSERRKAEARAALLLGAKNGPQLFDRLNNADRSDPGVMLAAVRYFRRSGEEPRAVSIARQAPTTPEALRNPSRWWYERRLLVRWAIKERRFDDAYAMAAEHGLAPGTDFSEAEFYAGWLALRYLGAPDRAETHFKALAANVSAPISVARAYYWLGRTFEARNEDTAPYYERAARHLYTFYGQLAAEKLGGDAAARTFEASPGPSPDESARFTARPTVAALRMLSELDDDQAFLVFAYHVDDQLETRGEYLALADITNARGAPHITVRAGKVSVRRGAFAPEVSYPLVYVPEEATRFAPQEVILGLSRQESEFNPRAYSRAGARGLMQLIPSTAQLTARKEGLRYSRSALLDDPIYNMTIGSAHLSHLFEKYNGSYVMTFAAYNAGPHRVTQWVESYGDPRSADIDPIDWAESIPFTETRNYVQRVLENTQVYRGRVKGGPIPGKLSADLERGGKRGRAGVVPAVRYAGGLAPVPPRTVNFAKTVELSAAPLTAPDVQLKPNAPAPVQSAPQPASPSTSEPAPQADAKPPAPTHDETPARLASEATPPVAVEQDQAPQETSRPEPGAQITSAPESPRASPTQPAATPEPPTTIEPSTSGELSTNNAPPAARALTREELDALARKLQTEAANREKSSTPKAATTDAAKNRPESKTVELSPVSAQDLNALQRESISAGNQIDAAASDASAVDAAACETYRGYIARTEKEDAKATDLNAGMLAELRGDGPACE